SQVPIDGDSGVFQERVNKSFGAARSGDQLRKYWRCDYKASPPECRFESILGRQMNGRVLVPERDHNIGVNRGCHCPRNPRSHRLIFFFPDPISGLPIPQYFENALSLRTGRIRMLFPSLSKIKRSPLRTPRTRRISRGTVICPLLVIVASFCISGLFPYFIIFALPCEIMTLLPTPECMFHQFETAILYNHLLIA